MRSLFSSGRRFHSCCIQLWERFVTARNNGFTMLEAAGARGCQISRRILGRFGHTIASTIALYDAKTAAGQFRDDLWRVAQAQRGVVIFRAHDTGTVNSMLFPRYISCSTCITRSRHPCSVVEKSSPPRNDVTSVRKSSSTIVRRSRQELNCEHCVQLRIYLRSNPRLAGEENEHKQ